MSDLKTLFGEIKTNKNDALAYINALFLALSNFRDFSTVNKNASGKVPIIDIAKLCKEKKLGRVGDILTNTFKEMCSPPIDKPTYETTINKILSNLNAAFLRISMLP